MGYIICKSGNKRINEVCLKNTVVGIRMSKSANDLIRNIISVIFRKSVLKNPATKLETSKRFMSVTIKAVKTTSKSR